MTKTILSALALMISMTSASNAFADDIQVGLPGYGGSGCPSGSASVTLSPDQKSLSILFDQYIVEAGRDLGKRLDRKSCNIAVPVHIPQGYSISIFQVDYRGFNALPAGARSQFNVEYFFAGQQGPRATRSFYGPTSRDYLLTNQIGAEALVWSPCGADTNLRVNTSMLVQSNMQGEQAFATVDSADVKAGIEYHIQWRRCGR